jgi:hypothetical protein
MVFDCFPFFNELDILEIRLHELSSLVDRFLIVEAGETYGGEPKPFHLLEAMHAGRFDEFADRMTVIAVDRLRPGCMDRISGRLREADQRERLFPEIMKAAKSPDDIVLFSDCDEIPSREAARKAINSGIVHELGVHRFKQNSYYYNVHTLVDYGHDFASRARIGTVEQLNHAGGMYAFRMTNKSTNYYVIEEGGWHFSYFGGPDRIKTKVAALSPFLSEYKLFGDDQLEKDIEERRDLHHRKCEMPEIFGDGSGIKLPRYLEDNRDRFAHFFRKTAAV